MNVGEARALVVAVFPGTVIVADNWGRVRSAYADQSGRVHRIGPANREAVCGQRRPPNARLVAVRPGVIPAGGCPRCWPAPL